MLPSPVVEVQDLSFLANDAACSLVDASDSSQRDIAEFTRDRGSCSNTKTKLVILAVTQCLLHTGAVASGNGFGSEFDANRRLDGKVPGIGRKSVRNIDHACK
jgi:hypothetical protein